MAEDSDSNGLAHGMTMTRLDWLTSRSALLLALLLTLSLAVACSGVDTDDNPTDDTVQPDPNPSPNPDPNPTDDPNPAPNPDPNPAPNPDPNPAPNPDPNPDVECLLTGCPAQSPSCVNGMLRVFEGEGVFDEEACTCDYSMVTSDDLPCPGGCTDDADGEPACGLCVSDDDCNPSFCRGDSIVRFSGSICRISGECTAAAEEEEPCGDNEICTNDIDGVACIPGCNDDNPCPPVITCALGDVQAVRTDPGLCVDNRCQYGGNDATDELCGENEVCEDAICIELP